MADFIASEILFFDVIRAICNVDVRHTLLEISNNPDGGKSWELPLCFLVMKIDALHSQVGLIGVREHSHKFFPRKLFSKLGNINPNIGDLFSS